MTIDFKNLGPHKGASQKNTILNLRVDKQENFLAYLLFNGIKKDPSDYGGYDE